MRLLLKSFVISKKIYKIYKIYKIFYIMIERIFIIGILSIMLFSSIYSFTKKAKAYINYIYRILIIFNDYKYILNMQ